MGPVGWYQDPFALHELRWFSDGRPTDLVSDGRVVSRDGPPSQECTGPLIAAGDEPAVAADRFTGTEEIDNEPEPELSVSERFALLCESAFESTRHLPVLLDHTLRACLVIDLVDRGVLVDTGRVIQVDLTPTGWAAADALVHYVGRHPDRDLDRTLAHSGVGVRDVLRSRPTDARPGLEIERLRAAQTGSACTARTAVLRLMIDCVRDLLVWPLLATETRAALLRRCGRLESTTLACEAYLRRYAREFSIPLGMSL